LEKNILQILNIFKGTMMNSAKLFKLLKKLYTLSFLLKAGWLCLEEVYLRGE